MIMMKVITMTVDSFLMISNSLNNDDDSVFSLSLAFSNLFFSCQTNCILFVCVFNIYLHRTHTHTLTIRDEPRNDGHRWWWSLIIKIEVPRCIRIKSNGVTSLHLIFKQKKETNENQKTKIFTPFWNTPREREREVKGH